MIIAVYQKQSIVINTSTGGFPRVFAAGFIRTRVRIHSARRKQNLNGTSVTDFCVSLYFQSRSHHMLIITDCTCTSHSALIRDTYLALVL